MTLKRLTVIIVTCLMAFYLPLATGALLSDSLTDTDQYAAVLISNHAIYGNDYWASPIAFLGSYPVWTYYFNSRGMKIKYFFWATMQDFKKVLTDDRYQSIVLIGHGSYNEWRASDGFIDNFSIRAMRGQFKKKKGEWFQLTCPAQSFSTTQLGELIMANDNVYYYNGHKADSYDFVLDALTAFWNIKNEAKKRTNK